MMKRLLTALAVVGTVTAPALIAPVLAAEDAAAPSCEDYTAMSEADRVKAAEKMISAMPESEMPKESMSDEAPSMSELGSGGTAGGTMASDKMTAMAEEACSAHPDGSVTDALGMMQGS